MPTGKRKGNDSACDKDRLRLSVENEMRAAGAKVLAISSKKVRSPLMVQHKAYATLRKTGDKGFEGNVPIGLKIKGAKTEVASVQNHFKNNTGPLKLAVSPEIMSAALSRFGLKTFKEGQERAIHAILNGENAAVIFPTGGGVFTRF